MEHTKRFVLCTGKVYYDLLDKRNALGRNDIALIRMEQLYPFPEDELKEILSVNPYAEIVWCQEEPLNMGAWTFMDRRLERVLRSIGATHPRPYYAGRPESPTPATGSSSKHAKEQDNVVMDALINPAVMVDWV